MKFNVCMAGASVPVLYLRRNFSGRLYWSPNKKYAEALNQHQTKKLLRENPAAYSIEAKELK